jgi:hypothetical protein
MLNFPQSQNLNFNAPNVQCIHIVFIVFVKLRSKSPIVLQKQYQKTSPARSFMSCRETLEASKLSC